MCGIFGFITDSANGGISAENAEICLHAMSHRGPDANAIEAFSPTGTYGFLGHVRLSIIDLSGGRQPMRSVDSNLLLTLQARVIISWLHTRHRTQQTSTTVLVVTFTSTPSLH